MCLRLFWLILKLAAYHEMPSLIMSILERCFGWYEVHLELNDGTVSHCLVLCLVPWRTLTITFFLPGPLHSYYCHPIVVMLPWACSTSILTSSQWLLVKSVCRLHHDKIFAHAWSVNSRFVLRGFAMYPVLCATIVYLVVRSTSL